MRAKPTLYTVAFLVFGLGAIFLSQRGWLNPVEDILMRGFAPLQWAATSVINPVSSLVSDLGNLDQIRDENDRYRKAIDQLMGEVVRLREAEIENQRLKAELNFKNANRSLEFLPANVIERDPSNVIQAITIDKGTEHGVKTGMVVVSPSSVVGKVVKAYSSSSKVLLITDPSSSVNGMIQRPESRAFGLVNGKTKWLEMKYLPQSEEVKVNDSVVTSGLGGSFPKGLFIGRIAEVRRNDLEMFQEARVEPGARFSKLESVMIITNFVPSTLQ